MRGLSESVGELEAAAKSLQEAGKGLTREKLLDMVIAAPSDARIRGYVRLARGGMDYSFFQALTDKIEKASGDEKAKLEHVREKLLDYTNEADRQIEARYKQSQKFIETLLAQEDIAKATQDNLQSFTQETVDLVQQMLRQASEKNDYATMGKLQKMIEVLQQASAPPPEVAFIEQLLEAPDAPALDKMLNENAEAVTDQFMEYLSGLVTQIEAQAGQGNAEAKALADKLGEVYKTALKFSMKKKMG